MEILKVMRGLKSSKSSVLSDKLNCGKFCRKKTHGVSKPSVSSPGEGGENVPPARKTSDDWDDEDNVYMRTRDNDDNVYMKIREDEDNVYMRTKDDDDNVYMKTRKQDLVGMVTPTLQQCQIQGNNRLFYSGGSFTQPYSKVEIYIKDNERVGPFLII